MVADMGKKRRRLALLDAGQEKQSQEAKRGSRALTPPGDTIYGMPWGQVELEPEVADWAGPLFSKA